MNIERTFVPKKETAGCIVFEEQAPQGQPVVMGSAYVKKNMLPMANRTAAGAVPIKLSFELPDEPAAAPSQKATKSR